MARTEYRVQGDYIDNCVKKQFSGRLTIDENSVRGKLHGIGGGQSEIAGLLLPRSRGHTVAFYTLPTPAKAAYLLHKTDGPDDSLTGGYWGYWFDIAGRPADGWVQGLETKLTPEYVRILEEQMSSFEEFRASMVLWPRDTRTDVATGHSH